MRVTRILHHSFNVQGQLAATVEFYRRLLGLSDDPRPEIPGVDGHWFGIGSAQLHLVDAPTGAGPIQPTGPHVCFAVSDLEEAIAELEREGVPYLRGAQGTTVQIWFTDPAGSIVEIQQDTQVQPLPE